MSLGVVFKSPEGLVLAADSRVTLTGQKPLEGGPPGSVQLLPAYFDSANKLLSVNCQSHVGMVTYGATIVSDFEASSQSLTSTPPMPEAFQANLLGRHDPLCTDLPESFGSSDGCDIYLTSHAANADHPRLDVRR